MNMFITGYSFGNAVCLFQMRHLTEVNLSLCIDCKYPDSIEVENLGLPTHKQVAYTLKGTLLRLLVVTRIHNKFSEREL